MRWLHFHETPNRYDLSDAIVLTNQRIEIGQRNERVDEWQGLRNFKPNELIKRKMLLPPSTIGLLREITMRKGIVGFIAFYPDLMIDNLYRLKNTDDLLRQMQLHKAKVTVLLTEAELSKMQILNQPK
jgi:hypothetical protein